MSVMNQQIGSFDWTKQSNGKLSLKEKLSFVQRVMLPSTIGFLKTQLKLDKADHQIDLNQIKIPDTAMVKTAIEALEVQSNPMLINHSWRSYLWGAGLACVHQKTYDAEVLLTSALYHDIGLTDQHLHGTDCTCFTLKGALAFESDAKKIDYPIDKINLVKDVICMHMNGYSDETDPSEITLLQYGVTCDVIGTQLLKLPKNYTLEVLQQYPRENFKQDFKARLKLESQKDRHSRTAVLSILGLPMMLSLSPFKE